MYEYIIKHCSATSLPISTSSIVPRRRKIFDTNLWLEIQFCVFSGLSFGSAGEAVPPGLRNQFQPSRKSQSPEEIAALVYEIAALVYLLEIGSNRAASVVGCIVTALQNFLIKSEWCCTLPPILQQTGLKYRILYRSCTGPPSRDWADQRASALTYSKVILDPLHMRSSIIPPCILFLCLGIDLYPSGNQSVSVLSPVPEFLQHTPLYLCINESAPKYLYSFTCVVFCIFI